MWLIRRVIIPELFIGLSVKMNRGTANGVTLWVPLIGNRMIVAKGSSGAE